MTSISRLALLLVSIPAYSAEPCHSYADFSAAGRKFETCDDNAPLGEDALICMDFMLKRVEAGQQQIQNVIEAEAKRQKSAQDDSLRRASSGYQQAATQADQLIAEVNAARATLLDYHRGLAFPEDYDEPELTGMSTEAYLKAERCYDVPRNAIVTSKKALKRIARDLTKLRGTLAGLSSGAASRATQVQATTPNAGAAATKGQGSAKPVPGGTAPKAGNDITGVQKALDDKAKAQQLLRK